MGAISLRKVEKTYGRGPGANKVIHGVDAEITDGEFIVIARGLRRLGAHCSWHAAGPHRALLV